MPTCKKPKTESDQESLDEFDKLRNWLMKCPDVSEEHPAFQAALQGLEKEKKRFERDLKLKRKFQKEQDAPVTVERPLPPAPASSTQARDSRDAPSPEVDDWHDLSDAKADDSTVSFLGKELASESVNLISANDARASSPLAAIALALHAAVCGKTFGFNCTGINDEDKKVSTGFASPVREIRTFLPEKWQDSPNCVHLRYRKKGAGGVALKVCSADHAVETSDTMIEITFTPQSSPEPRDTMVVRLIDHLNLESWSRAVSQDLAVAPALHYKRLAELMSQFAKMFDFGVDAKQGSSELQLPSDTSRQFYSKTISDTNNSFSAPRPCGDPLRISEPWNDRDGPTLERAFPGLVGGGNGQFSGDLTPGGIRGPGLPGMDPSQGGSLMGPNHPAFSGGDGIHPGGFGMQPRFDPFGPSPTHPGNNHLNGVPGRHRRPGEPNPDHMRPPDNLGNNMFM